MTGREPHVLAVVFCSILGAVGSTYLQRYFLIVGTGFGGAWTLIVGAMAAVGNRAGLAAAGAAGSVWVPYPLDPGAGPVVGADCVGPAGLAGHHRAAGVDRRRERPRRAPSEESLTLS